MMIATLGEQTAPQSGNCATEVVRHEAVDDRVDTALDVGQQMNDELKT